MRLTLQTDYSIRVLMFLGMTTDRLVTIKEISEVYGISKNHLMKVVHQLGQRNYIETVRGKNGGLQLGLSPSEINLGALVREVEPDLSIVECFMENGRCRLTAGCRLTGVLREALTAFLVVLDKYSLADLLDNPSQLSGLLGLTQEAV